MKLYLINYVVGVDFNEKIYDDFLLIFNNKNGLMVKIKRGYDEPQHDVYIHYSFLCRYLLHRHFTIYYVFIAGQSIEQLLQINNISSELIMCHLYNVEIYES